MFRPALSRRLPPLLVLAFLGPLLLRAADSEKPAKQLVNRAGMKLALILRGEFRMGSEELPSEKPVHPVRITRGFYLAVHPITVGQFRAFVKDAGYRTQAETNGKGAIGF